MDGGFVIRAASASDQWFISEMQYEACFVPPGADPFPRAILDEPNITRYHVGFGTQVGDAGFVAAAPGGELLGAAWVRLVEGYGFVDHDTPELCIAVVERLRGRGIGTALLEHLLDAVPRCSLSVDTRNPAVNLYAGLGFATVRRDDSWTAVMLRER